ncbi:tryptophan halogenase family protein [Aliikangiella coralliicola]|uniref:Tryptophan 7-halogenase n=1 Tax=Aliikangiella coralliicola TaxID=2592383 RepID=A0A545UHJ1_9GAMM|nr:tryptophan halogenase family protein [Aliikangiella coralliicola]TQV88929.1 tryptophan 7-halogenase [Aliikangiella coralliicola]
MTESIDRVLVVGGGTAGWLSAAILARSFNSHLPGAVKVTLVESPDIPILGVGEGTWPTIRATLKKIGVDESEFMKECDATFKQGSEFVNWMATDDYTTHRYFHPLSAVFHSAYDFSLAPYWLSGSANDLPYDIAVASQTAICKMGLAPKKITTPAYEAIQNYSYHLNANKFAAFLTRHCVEKLGVEHLVANVTDVELDEAGFIRAVNTDNHTIESISADFFVDCTGGRSILLGGALGVPWKKIDDVIFNDTALAMQVPYQTSDAPIATHTIATAHDAGWTWDIGLSNRRGVGYVYSSQHTTDEKAEETLRRYVGESADQLEARKIKLNLGYRTQFWKSNCLALGMSAAFIEPLEASAIFLIDAGATMLAAQFPRTKNEIAFVEKQYNKTFSLRWNKTLDFIKLHYCITNRRDTEFWVDNCREETIPDSLKEKLSFWKKHPPGKYEFDNAFEPFVLDSYLFVLYGMNFETDIKSIKAVYDRHAEARKRFEEVTKLTQFLSRELPKQRELVEKVYQYGFPAI